MKRVYLILTLFIASFFFVSLNKVSADTNELIVPESDFEYLTEDFFKFRELLIEYCNENNKKYIIVPNNSYPQRAIIFDEDNTGSTYYLDYVQVSGLGYLPRIMTSYSANTNVRYDSTNQKLKITGNDAQTINFRQTNGSDYYVSLRYYQDTNLDYIFYKDTSHIITFKYNNLSYELTQGTPPPSLYQIYMDSKVEDEPIVSDKFIEEKELMNNFYSTIFTKISDLATSLANNYIFLTIFGIFILIFVLELIRRYLL